MVSATSSCFHDDCYTTEFRATEGYGEREGEERDKKFTAVVSLRGWSAAAHTLSVNHNQSGMFASNPLSLDLSHESYSYLLRAQKAPSNGFMGPMSLAVGVDDVGPLAPSPTPRPPAAAPKSNKSRLPYCPSVASVLFVCPSASSRASPSAPRTSLDVSFPSVLLRVIFHADESSTTVYESSLLRRNCVHYAAASNALHGLLSLAWPGLASLRLFAR
ncbi:hypothetical protein CSIM01_04004 [Colletotrichum simmondsii]|uniref:Uncharacterized protein n=1 Tax=Colletotrichum simmondsii TaxID=703756 RepID=A0A135S633_9PEZI|nr:hypothetical protein CSIM01_04004 [Colletotrichum simmondsii]